eukprot:g8439.t1
MSSSVDRRPRWGDDEPGEEEALPPTEETELDENGIKLRTEYYRNEKGQTIKKTTKIRVVSVQQKVYKISKERREWERFGRAAGGTEGLSAKDNEDIPFENVRIKTATLQQKKIEDIQKNLQAADNKTIIGSLGDMLQQKREERQKLRAKGMLPPESEPPGMEESTKPAASQQRSDVYVPPKHREQEGGGFRRNNENSVRVTNIADNVAESDLRDLFSVFGDISRIYLAVDNDTGRNRGFAFVNFVRRSEAERAISVLDGYGYSNLILHCEWAAPKERK